jgi:hypothetical protein
MAVYRSTRQRGNLSSWLWRRRTPGVGIECDAGGAVPSWSRSKMGTERVEARLLKDGRWPPANNSCTGRQGLTTQLEETPIRESKLSANLHIASGWGVPGLRLMRACSGNVAGASLPLAATLQISKHQLPIRSRHEVGRKPFPE